MVKLFNMKIHSFIHKRHVNTFSVVQMAIALGMHQEHALPSQTSVLVGGDRPSRIKECNNVECQIVVSALEEMSDNVNGQCFGEKAKEGKRTGST